MNRVVLVLTLSITLASAGAARAEDAGFAPAVDAAGGFGTIGQLVLSLGPTTDEHLFFHKGGGHWQLQLAPAADYFITTNVSVGGVVLYGHESGGTGTDTNASGSDVFGLTARAGYALGLTGKFTLWPLAGLAVAHASANHTSSTTTALVLFVPAQYHLATHFFVGLGPSFRVKLSGGDPNQFGIDSQFGGWF
jgi:hypothetical protein